jgi:hypothetical protein
VNRQVSSVLAHAMGQAGADAGRAAEWRAQDTIGAYAYRYSTTATYG